MYKVQSVIFNKEKYDTPSAIKWLQENNYQVKKVDETNNFLRFRQINPSLLKRQGYTFYRSYKIGDVILVITYKP